VAREIAHMQVGQCGKQEAHAKVFAAGAGRLQVGPCGNQEAHAEVLCRRHRVVRAIAARANFP
jgi:hypothetical protein